METSKINCYNNVIYRTNNESRRTKSSVNFNTIENNDPYFVNFLEGEYIPNIKEMHHAKRFFQPCKTNYQFFSLSRNPSFNDKYNNYNEYSIGNNNNSRNKTINTKSENGDEILNYMKKANKGFISAQNSKQNLKEENYNFTSRKKIMSKLAFNNVNDNFKNVNFNNNENSLPNNYKNNNYISNNKSKYLNKVSDLKRNNNLKQNISNYSSEKNYIVLNKNIVNKNSNTEKIKVAEKDKNLIQQNKELEKKIKRLEEENKKLKMKSKIELENKFKELQNKTSIIEMLMKLEKIKNKINNLIVNNKLLIDNFRSFLICKDSNYENYIDYVNAIKAFYLKYLLLKKNVKQNTILNINFNKLKNVIKSFKLIEEKKILIKKRNEKLKNLIDKKIIEKRNNLHRYFIKFKNKCLEEKNNKVITANEKEPKIKSSDKTVIIISKKEMKLRKLINKKNKKRIEFLKENFNKLQKNENLDDNKTKFINKESKDINKNDEVEGNIENKESKENKD